MSQTIPPERLTSTAANFNLFLTYWGREKSREALKGTVHLNHPHVIPNLVSASDVTPTDCWLNVWCIWHTYLDTLQECRSRRRIGWIIQDFRETCVSRSLTFRLETKMPWCQTPSRKKKAVVFTNVTMSTYQDQLNTGFSKVCEIFKVRGIESLK